MSDKGGTGTSTFKLTVKVELLSKNKVNEHVLEQLQKAFQGNLANLQLHLQSYPELQSQHIHCVTNKKKYLAFEFWLKSAKALEQLKFSTEKDSLVNALSDFSEKKALGLDIGLSSQHLCFKCKIDGKQYALGQAHFMESSSESSTEEYEEAEDHEQVNAQPQAISSSAETKQEKVFGGLQKEEMAKKSTSQETSKVKEVASFFEPSNGTGKDASVKNLTQSGNEEAQLKRKNESELEGAQDVLPCHTDEAFIAIDKHFYLYLPYKHSDIQAVIMESNCKELHGKRLHLVSDSKYLWEVKVRLNPNIMDRQGTCHFFVEKIERWYLNLSSKTVPLRDDNAYKIDSSAIQRIFWRRSSEHGFLCHAQHIMLHCHEDMKDSILQMEALVTVMSSNLNNREVINVVKDLQKDNFLSDSKKCLMLGVLMGCSKELHNLVTVVDANVFQVLLHALCQLKRTDVPSSCISCLHKLSNFVMQRKYGKEFCLIHWMTNMFPFLDESIFLNEIELFNKNSKPIKTSDDEKTAELTMNVCSAIQDRIKKRESGNGPELLLSLMKNLPLSAAMKVYSQRIDREADFKDVKEKIVDGLVSEIVACASKYYKESNISKLRYLWGHVKGESYAHSLTATFEKHILGLLEKTGSLNDDYIALFEDEILFVKGLNQERLLRLIAKSPTQTIHEHMKALAQLRKYMPAIGTVAETWLETAVTKYTMSSHSASSQRLVSMYSYLWDAIFLQKAGDDEKLVQRLENKLYITKVKYMKTDDLLKIADQIFSTSRDAQLAQEIFQQHLMRLLKEQHGSEDTVKILISICGRDICISATWQANLVTTLLDLYGMKDGRPTPATIFSMLAHQNFWKAVLKVQGELARKVKMHPAYIAADDCITSLRKSVKDKTVTLGFIDKVATGDLMLKVASLLSDDSLQEENCLLDLKECHSSVIKQREIITLVGNTLENITKYFPGVDGLGMLSVKERVHMIDEELKTGNITVREMKETLWQPYDSVPSICEKLQIPCKSNVFWKVCIENKIGKKVKVKEANDAGESVVERKTVCQKNRNNENLNDPDVKITAVGDGIPVLDGLTLLKDLCEKGCDLYKEVWDDFYKGNDLSISVLQEMFRHGVNIPDEISYIEDFERKPLSGVSKSALYDYWNLRKYENTVIAMKNSLSAFMIVTVDDEFSNAVQAFEDLATGDADSLTLFQIHHAVKTVKEASGMLSEDAIDMLNALGKSSTLIHFLSDIVDEDIRNLIDAVEEVSEKFVKESTVSGLIEVKRFLHPFLIKDSQLKQSQDVFFREFAEKFQELVFKDPVLKTNDCIDNLHNLKSLYNNVANRSERTREIIRNIIENGIFCFNLNHHECMLTVTYKQNETISKASLVDLRSRALLLMNTARKENPEDEAEDKQEYLGKYVTYIDLGFEIAELCTSLSVAGHFNFTKFDEEFQPDDLEECKVKMKEEFVAWQRDILQCREEYYYMNFLLGGQIQTLYSYLQTESFEGKMAADTFLKFIHPLAGIEAVCKCITRIHSNILNQEVLMNMGRALEQAFRNLEPVWRQIELPESSLHITESIQKGKLLVVSLDEDSKLMVRTVLGLYQNNAKTMPEAQQLLFCRRETTWDEIHLLLKRCLGASKFGRGDSLFCLANVEMLSNENQFQLVDSLRKLPKDGTFLLAIIFRGAEHHPFLHEFSDCVTRIHPMTEASLQMWLQKECPEIFTVTSDVPGLGKTETIKRHAHQIWKKCVTLHISGPLNKHTLVERLAKLNIKEDVVLHIDIGNTPDTEELDTFLFEFLVLHYVSAYTKSVFLTTTSVCIELANTMNNTLPNSLPIVTSFNRKNIKWEGFKSFHVSNELNSPLQVVCHYLNAVEDRTLDQRDIVFKGTKALKPLPMEKCVFLIQKYFRMNKDDMSFTLINCFVRVLSDQLKKLSCSSYFRISNLARMLERKNRESVKTDLVKAMVDVSVDFAGRSINGCRESQKSTAALSSCSTNLATSLANRVESMIRWEHSNHLAFLFHSQDVQTLSVLYRKVSEVPLHIRILFEKQMKKNLPDFAKMNQEELQDILQKVARSTRQCMPKKELQEMAKYYALTPDNLLKMVLIMLRIRAHIPVIVMGETGCGKTSLIQYLSKISDVDFNVKTIHAGIEEKEIIKIVEDVNSKALQSLKTRQQIWLFLDEINTNDHIWLLSDIICHHSCLGRKLAPNLVLMAACNPYRLRSESAIHTAGLDDKARTDELSRLLYRVHPLPETMVDYVWDFGSLSKTDEKMYIEQMVCGKLGLVSEMEKLLADALVISQEFIRTVEGVNCCVSLRDVRRCTDLTVWLKEFLCKKKKLKSYLHKGFYSSSDVDIRAIILALAHCYHSRLIDSRTRQKYREALFNAFIKHHRIEFMEDKIKEIIREEQEDILDRMELPPGVAKNTALQENVFVILVSILNRIPIFVVGKPGCSKSLSMQVIRSNLRGPDSKDELFKLLPQLYCVSFQGSESSTSDGIIKVFEKAQKYQESNSQEDVLSVVILDEIGLAEISRFNPLKVLHSLLEPLGKPHPDVAVVGISNWALDASKMNRAIHLSRPEMDEEELILTGKSISSSFAKSSEAHYPGIISTRERDLNMSLELKGIARGYFEFVSNQRFKNFFGLRDYYSLVKYFARELAHMTDFAINEYVKGDVILKGIQRNFGGLPSEIGLVRTCFEKHIDAVHNMHGQQNVPVLDLIKENIGDRSARHLLLITTGDSILGILEKQLKDQGRENVTIFGSKFEEDLTDDYSYRILSRIILCMEQGLVLILKDLETVYGSLYDMLNQNYTIVGNKKNCRIALGPYSNPMCYVHDDFKCIVLVEESELDHSDPPFLNRFEKQSLQYSDILGDENAKVVSELEHWVSSISTVAGKHFSPEDIIPVYGKDMLPSLVLHVCSQIPSECQTLQRKIEACKSTLLHVLKPEAIARIWISECGKACSKEELYELQESYFQMPIHEGLEHFLESEIGTNTEGVGKLIIVFTNSNIHTDLKKMVPGFKCQIEKLGAFKSEKQLTMQMEQFWHSSNKQILFLQCKADSDGKHILLSKSIIEKLQAEYCRGDSKVPKHMCLVVHLGRRAEEAKTVPQIDFLAKWKLVMLDSLSRPKTKLPELIRWSLMKTIELKRPLNDYIKEQLFTAFACIRYGTVGRNINSISHIITEINTSTEFLSCLECAVLKWIEEKYASDTDVDSWQVHVACDANALYTASSFIEALEGHILSVIFDPLAMLIYELEKQNLLDSFFVSDLTAEKRRHIWLEFFHDKSNFTIDDIPLPKGPECYAISTPVVKLHMPFSKLCFERIEEERDIFFELLKSTLLKYEADEVEDLDDDIVEGLCFRFSDIIFCKLGELLRLEYENCQMDYMHDFCTLTVARLSPEDITDEKITIMNCLLPQRCKVPGVSLSDACTLVHTTFWKNINVIMAEFIFIETCRELIDIQDILQELLTLAEEDLEERYAESGRREDLEGRIRTEALVRKSGVTSISENSSSDQEANSERIESSKIDEVHAVDDNYEIRLDTSPSHLGQTGDPSLADADVSEIVADSFAKTNDNLSNCSGYILKSDSEHKYSLEAAYTSEGQSQDEDGYKKNLHIALADAGKSMNEIAEDLHASDLVNTMFKETFERHEAYLTEESVDTLLKQEGTLDGEDKITEGAQFVHCSVPESMAEGCTGECIRDSHVMEINSSSSADPDVGNKSVEKSLEESIRVKNGQEQRDAQYTLQHILVEKLCKKILPSEEMFNSEKELEKWNIKVQSILSLAGRVSKECSLFYGLRFCSDLASLVLIPYKMDSFWLVQLGNLLQRDVAMDTEEFMEKISEMLIFFGSSNIKVQDQQKVFSQFILRCLQAYRDVNVINWFLYMVEKNAVPDVDLAYLKNPLHYVSFMEMGENVSQCIFSHILDLEPEKTNELLQESQFLSSLNSSIETQAKNMSRHNPLAILLVDVFEQEIFHSLLLDMESLVTDTAIERLLKVERIILTEEFSLRQLLAVAYFRRFVKILGVGLQNEDPRLNHSYLQKLDACLRGSEKDENNGKRLSLQLFLLKVLKSSLRFTKFNKLCQNLSGKLTFISSLWKCRSSMNSADNSPLALYNIEFHSDARNAFDSSSDELKNFTKKAASDSDQMLSLHSVLMEQFFLKKVLMELTDSDRTKANEVEDLCKECEVDEFNFRLIQFHLGKRDYEIIDALNMNLHQGSSRTDMQITTFVTELASLALSSSIKNSSLFLKCFLHPEQISGVFLPGIEVHEPHKFSVTAPKIVFGSCISHHRFAFSDIDVIEDQCPKCASPIVKKNAPTTDTSYHSVSGGNGPGMKLTTISQHLQQMIIHGLLIASLAAGYSKPNLISGLLKEKRQKEVGIAQYLYQSVQQAFKHLEDMMGIRQTDLDCFLHVLLSRTRPLLWETCTTFTEECERNVWEKEFTCIVNSLINERFAAVCEGKRQVMALHRLDETDVEHQVEEVSEVGWCPHLFRLTMEPSLENLSLELYQENKANSFPFLALVLKALPKLELIQHIKPLINWHKACVMYASYHKKKADCIKSGYTVSSFICEENNQNQREILERKFDGCKKAWETIRGQAASLNLLPTMGRLHDLSKLENCLILDKSSPMYNILEVLVSIQNDFIDETLAVSVQNYVPALHFLQKNTTCASLPCVSIADVKKDNIITFQWSDRYLKFSQCNIQYGHGRKIDYDFRTIEMELANSLLLGKCYLLLEESFPRIVFTDELYKTYILMIKELKSVIPQQKLKSDVEAGILSKRKLDPKLIADFLNHLGIIVSLLRRTGGKPETPLVEFVDNWSYVLTRPFPKQVLPSPEDAIHLCHIVELNELLEELNADGSIDSLEDEYRVPLDGSSHTFIDGFLSRSVLMAEVVLKAEKRFVHRCLLHREVAPMDSLLDHMKDHYFWPEGSLNDGWLQVGSQSILLADLFPGSVRVKHISSYVQFLRAKIEFLKLKDLRITHGTSAQTKPGNIGSKRLVMKKQNRLFGMET